MRFFILLLSLSTLVSCASKPPRERRSAGYISATSQFEKKIPPPWIRQSPKISGWRFFVGESLGALDREEAMERSWVSAFVRAGMAEFPELSSVSTESKETLTHSTHERKFAMRLERVNWSGIQEATDMGSPFIQQDEDTGRYSVYRLLRWRESDLASSKKQLSKLRVNRLPLSPESARRYEQKLVMTVQKMQTANERASVRNTLLDKVLSDIKCGVTLGDLIEVLGAPDRFNPYNNRLFEKEYFWGSYRVERFGPDPRVAAVSRTDGEARRKIICRSR